MWKSAAQGRLVHICRWRGSAQGHYKGRNLLTLVECAEGEAGEELHVVFLHVDCGKRVREGKEGEKTRREALQTHVLV